MNYNIELKDLGVMPFGEFLQITAEGLANGRIKISTPLTMLDMAVQYAAGVLHIKGQDTFTEEDLHLAISHYIGNWIFGIGDRPFPPEAKPIGRKGKK